MGNDLANKIIYNLFKIYTFASKVNYSDKFTR